MRILSLNTANKQSDIAVFDKGKLFEKKMSAREKHSESAMLGVDSLLKEANLEIKDLDAMAVVVGPGSFTGIRIGISLALGFKTVFQDLKLIEISTFEFLKSQFLKDFLDIEENFLCVFNALSGKFFVQEFDKKGNSMFEPKMVEGLDFVKNYDIIVGLEEENMSFVTHKLVLRAQTLSAIAEKKFKNGDFKDNLTPLYLRKSQAEDMLEKKKVDNKL